MMILITNSFTYLKSQPWVEHGKLKVSEINPHYLSFDDGTPFFWLGDTGWEMLWRLSREEIEVYLENRRNKGFNVIQTVIIGEFIHSDKATNYYNDSLFIGEDPLKPKTTNGNNPNNPNEYDFWDNVDYAVKLAEKKGLYLALVPTWGEWVIPRVDKPLFNTNEQAYQYGWFVGNRYREFQNIIWILGGDRHPDERPIGIDLWRSMAEGIADGTNNVKLFDGKADYSSTLMTHHSFFSSSNWFHNDQWIDLHLWGSYHAEINNTRSYLDAIKDYNLLNPKPTINAEPCYEGHGINYAIDDNGVFTSTDVRIAAYWSVFSGSAGFTYGAQPVWQFTDKTRKKLSTKTFQDWKQGLEYPGSSQMKYLRKLMESRPMFEMVPDQSLIVSGQGDCANYIAAIRGKSYAYIYIPSGEKPEIKLGAISGSGIKASWFDPRTGNTTEIGIFENKGTRSFDVPGMSKELSWLKSGRGCDWVLILEDASLVK
ncbi:MAG: glycoside hydrolase family 140 protein [Bacteroidales bacterium]